MVVIEDRSTVKLKLKVNPVKEIKICNSASLSKPVYSVRSVYISNQHEKCKNPADDCC
jgi:hypothetical protein